MEGGGVEALEGGLGLEAARPGLVPGRARDDRPRRVGGPVGAVGTRGEQGDAFDTFEKETEETGSAMEETGSAIDGLLPK